MKILFFCGSLEPGQDGVGDYTRRLAEECAARGHACSVIGLHDPGVTRVTTHLNDIRLIRLPATDPWPERLAGAAQHLQGFEPDWVSWQIVAYGFNARGYLPSALLEAAPELRGQRCHAMLHELWIGMEAGASWRARAIGWRQRRGVLCLLDRLDPDCIQTSQTVYQHALMREGIGAGRLGLFSNIPIAEPLPERRSPLARWLPAAQTTGAAPLVALTFGTLHPQWRPAATVEWFLATARRLGRSPALIVTGRAGAHAPAILEHFRRQGVHVAVTGELDAVAISHLLQAADFGIAAHPWALIGKSGAAAAMLEHGLPVLVPRDDWRLRDEPALRPVATDALLARLGELDAARTDAWLASRRAPAPALRETTDALLAALSSTDSGSPILSA